MKNNRYILIGVLGLVLMLATIVLLRSETFKGILDKDHGVGRKAIGDYEFFATYAPSEASTEAEEENPYEYVLFRIGLKEGGNSSVLKYNLSSEDEYYERLEYFAFEMQKDIYMMEGEDTLNCVLFHFERTFDLAPFVNFSLAFEPSKGEIPRKVLLYDDKMLGVGPVNISL